MTDLISHKRSQRRAGWNESGLSCSFLATTTKKTPNGLMRYTVLSGNLPKGYVLLTDTAHHVWLCFRWDAMVRLIWAWMLVSGDDRGKTAKHLLECKQFVIELAVRNYKVDQHW